MRKQLPNIEKLRRIRTAHDLRSEGCSSRDIAVKLGLSRDTVQQYWKHPKPTDQELAAAAALIPRPIVSGRRPDIRVKTDPDTLERLCVEARHQGCSLSQLGDLALQLYLDAAQRLRSGTSEPINLRGYVNLPESPPALSNGRKPSRYRAPLKNSGSQNSSMGTHQPTV